MRSRVPSSATHDSPHILALPPRRDRWADYFRWRGPRLVGLTPVGRATIRVLGINDPDAVALRRELIAEGVFPPP